MTVLLGLTTAACLSLLMIMAGYNLAGFLPDETRLNRLAVASLTGLAWLVFGASVVGAITSLHGLPVCLLWSPSLLVWLIPRARRQLWDDTRRTFSTPGFYFAAGGTLILFGCLFLPFVIHPDLVFFDGKTNHDNFFWCVAAEYLQAHRYLSAPIASSTHPLFNTVGAILGWHPDWGRMGAEGFIAVVASSVGQSPVRIYNFAVGALVPAWLFTVLAIARQMRGPSLNRWWLVLVCCCQPILIFFIANGNLPNLLGALLAGGLWLLTLRSIETESRSLWPIVIAGALFTHGLLCSYPEILPFALLPIVLAVGWQWIEGVRRHVAALKAATRRRTPPSAILIYQLGAGLCLNPLTTVRAWHGFWHSFSSARDASTWANVFAPLDFTGYVPSFITLAMPSMRLLGPIGGSIASLAVLIAFCVLLQKFPPVRTMLFSLSGFFVLLVYTELTSFEYGWQKSVQFAAVPLAVLFPVLLAGALQDSFSTRPVARLRPLGLIGALGFMIYGTLGTTAEILKSAGNKGLTSPLLELGRQAQREFPGQTILVDGATFRAAFFHSMWSAQVFAGNPIAFLPREDQPGGYLKDSVERVKLPLPASNQLYYVDADWAKAFDFQPLAIGRDRVGTLIHQHNLVTDQRGFHPTTGVPEWADDSFSLTIQPYADGWLELTLSPNGQTGSPCQLRGTVVTPSGTETITVPMNSEQRLVVRFPLRAGVSNKITAHLSGAPAVDPDNEQTRYPFRVVKVWSARSLPPRS